MAEELKAGSVVVSIVADLAQLKQGLKESKEQIGGFLGTMKEEFLKLGKTIVAAFAVEKVFEWGVELVKHFMKVQKAMYLLGQQVTRSGGNWGDLKDSVEAYMEAQERSYEVDKTQVADSLRQLILLTGNLKDAIGLNNMALKLSKAGNMDLTSASELLGLAFQGNERGIIGMGRALGLTRSQSSDVTRVFEALRKKTVELNDDTETLSMTWHIWWQNQEEKLEGVGAKLGGWFQSMLSASNKRTEYEKIYNEALEDEGFKRRILDEQKRKAAEYDNTVYTIQGMMANSTIMSVLEEMKQRMKLANQEKGTDEKTLANKAKKAQANAKALAEGEKEIEQMKQIYAEQQALGTEQDQFIKGINRKSITLFSLLKGLGTSLVSLSRKEGETFDAFKIRVKGQMDDLKAEAQAKVDAVKTFADGIANAIGASMETFVQNVKDGTMQVSQVFEVLGRSIVKSIIGALGEVLIQMGAADLAQAIAGMFVPANPFIHPNMADSPGLFMAAAGLTAAGGAIKGAAAAFLAEGGRVHARPGGVSAVLAEAGEDEIVTPLSKVKETFGSNVPNIENLHLTLKTNDLSLSRARRFARETWQELLIQQKTANRRMGTALA